MPPVTPEEFRISLGIQVKENQSIETTIRQVEELTKWCERMGKSSEFAERAVQSLLSHRNLRRRFSDGGTLTDLGKTVIDEVEKKKQEAHRKEREKAEKEQAAREKKEAAERRKSVSTLSQLANPFAFIDAKSGINVQRLLTGLTGVLPKLQGFSIAFQTAKGAWSFAEAVAELNTKILQLGVTSGLGAQQIMNLGAAVTAFGGSAEKVAQGNERFILQIERLKRGGGLGYLGDVAYKYGFMVDMSADWATNNKAAIDYARQMMAAGDKTGAMAFLKEWDSANYTSNMMKASMSAEQVAANDKFYEGYDALGDVDRVTEETQKFNEETAKAQRAWMAITNQLATMMLPLMTKLTSFVTKITDLIAKSPTALRTIQILLGAIMGITVALIAKELMLTTAKIAGAIATGNWAGAAIAGALIGVGIAGTAMAMGGGIGSEVSSPQAIKSVAENSVSVDALLGGDKSLSGREKFLLDESDSKFKEALGTGAEGSQLAQNTETLADVMARLSNAANETAESMKHVADEAMSLEQAEKMANVLSSVNNVSNLANSNAQANVNVNIEQQFNEADTSEIRAGIFDIGSELQNQIAQASRKFNT